MIAPDRTRARTAKRKENATVKSLGGIADTLKLTATSMLLAGLGLLCFGVPGASAAGPELTVQVSHSPATFHRGELGALGTSDSYLIEVINTGDSPTVGTVTVTDTLPEGVKLGINGPTSGGIAMLCASDGEPGHHPGASVLTCSFSREPETPGPPITENINPGQAVTIAVPVSVFDPPDSVVNHVTVSGGGAPEVSAQDVTPVADRVPYSVKEFTSNTTNEGGSEYSVAGGHPFQNRTRFSLPLNDNTAGKLPVEQLKDASVDLVNGFFGNPAAASRCEISKVEPFEFPIGSKCPADSRVGYAELNDSGFRAPLFNVKPERGYPAEFAFNPGGPIVPIVVIPRARTESYGLTLGTTNAARVGIWAFTTVFNGTVANATEAPFLSNPVDCSQANPLWNVSLDSWEKPGRLLPSGRPDLNDPNWKSAAFLAPPVTGCGDPELASQFEEASLGVKPLQGNGPAQADQPTGLAVDLDFPQSNDPTDPNANIEPDKPQAPEPKDITLKLPAGLAISPSSATGLAGCSDLASDPAGDQVHYDTTEPVTCPDASKIGTVTATTPLLAKHDPSSDDIVGADPIPGDVYLLKPHPGDFATSGKADGTFRLLLQLDYPRYGINFKLPGTAVADKQTGQLITTFTDNPQLPTRHLTVSLKPGPRAPLASPPICGDFEATSTMVPWSAPETPNATPSSSFNVGSGPNGSPCAGSPGARPFSPGLSAGSASARAGTPSPFVLKVTREDGEQELGSINVTTPPGFSAKLAGVASCSDAAIAAAVGKSGADEQANPSCPASSQVGTVSVGAGPGSSPFYTPGKVYLAGPYKGAPLSFAFITPVVAGPFDLGDSIVRAAVYLNSETTQVTVKTDPLPQVLDGVPLRIRSLETRLDRADFTLNPTNCRAMAVSATVNGSDGAAATPTQHFQASDCNALGFKPSLKLALKGQVARRAHPSLKATLTARPGDANIASAQVKLPQAAFLDNAHIGQVCTRVQFAADQCPEGSIYGTATAKTPLLDYQLTGNVYLRSSSHKLPDLVVGFKGPSSQPIEIELAGKTDSVKGALRNTFEAVPDVPVTEFSLTLFGGKKGLIIMSSGFCAHPEAGVKFTGQNGAAYDTTPKVAAKCPKNGNKGKGKKGPKKRTLSSLSSALGW